MSGQELPGYYYDTEKGKYFKIQKHNQAPPGNAYTKENLDKARAREIYEENTAKRRKIIEIQTVKRSSILQSSAVSSYQLNRQSALEKSPSKLEDNSMRAYASGFEPAWIQNLSDVALTENFGTEPPEIPVRHCAWDNLTSGYVIASTHSWGAVIRSVIHERFTGHISHKHTIHRLDKGISSISISFSRVVAMTSLGEIYFVVLADPSDHEPGTPPDFDVAVRVSTSEPEDLWSSAPRPLVSSTTSSFAVGMNKKAVLYTGEHQWATTQKVDVVSDAWSLDWLSSSTCCVGQRNGQVVLWDVRSEGSALRLKHQTSATDIRAIDTNSIVVNGLYGRTALYDLRMPVRESKSQLRRSGPSKPIVEYNVRRSESSSRGSFDVDKTRSLMAVSNDVDVIELFSLYNDKPAKILKPPPDLLHRSGDFRFYETEKHHGLITFTGEGILGYEWFPSRTKEDHIDE